MVVLGGGAVSYGRGTPLSTGRFQGSECRVTSLESKYRVTLLEIMTPCVHWQVPTDTLGLGRDVDIDDMLDLMEVTDPTGVPRS